MPESREFAYLHVVDHPVVADRLARIRDAATPLADFRRLIHEISLLIGYEITRTLPAERRRVRTPVGEIDAPVLAGPAPAIVPILRAGLGMAEGLRWLLPDAVEGHIGCKRDETTREPQEYLVSLPLLAGRPVLLVDPMIATGGTAVHALDVLLRRGVSEADIRFMGLVAAPEGMRRIRNRFARLPVWVAALDERLDDNAYIVPGIGDAGDRLFGTI